MYFLIGLCFLNLVVCVWFFARKNKLGMKNVLVCIAHPDDECMFFAPLISQLVSEDCTVSVHCFSNGNAEGLGKQREKELESSCKLLGVSKVSIGKFKDGFDQVWNHNELAKELESHFTESAGSIAADSFDCIFTFDGNGVSGHPNHIDCRYGVRKFCHSHKIPVYELESVNLFRKYSAFFDVVSVASLCVFVPVKYFFRSYQAMKCHQSQLVWFRRLYILFSRYMYINTFKVYRE